MRLWSQSFSNGEPLPASCLGWRLAADGALVPAENRHPHLAWDEVPPGTRSFVLIGQDFDGLDPSVVERAPPAAVWIEETPRVDHFLWLLADLPADWRRIDEGQFGPGTWHAAGDDAPGSTRPDGVRQGLNDGTRWFARDPKRRGRHLGYLGPLPLPQDRLVHHCAFTVYALDVPQAPVADPFDGPSLRSAIFRHVLAAATLSCTCTLQP